ncbi:alkaline phosphatase D family protein [Fodinibius halophilus]|uniref:Alkaline phosphatase family protein n=1 Tax=Fodinibius halophilus TaxID=1736908 RepID=A0A6M1SZN9_9BACT|nr:alkaline phosphatase D family protein [Fodinibius halophilus]NGP87137.1 alkaline phosphatase family protein [Fodinibius halophilus]
MRKKLLSLFILLIVSTVTLYGQQTTELLEAGPMLGYVEMQEANLWLQTTKPAEFELKYWKKGEKNNLVQSVKNETRATASNTAHIKLADLKIGATYSYDLYIEGEKVSLPYDTEFSTQELWQWRRDAPDFKVAMGSCLYINDSKYDRPGTPYGKGTEILRKINKQDPDIMLWLGDNVYYREPDFYSKSRMDYRFKDARNTPDMQPLLANAVNLATWDDHDYGPNNSDRSYRMREEALDIFKRYWVNPSYGTAEAKGVFTKYKYSDVEFFFMDDRYHRAPNNIDSEEKDFFGDAQLQWLKDSLVGSYATFKIIVVGNQVTNKMNDHESLVAYGEEYDNLMAFLDKHDIPGVLFISGDRHFTELLKTEREEGYPIYEFTSSPLSSGVYSTLDESNEYQNPQRVEGTLVHKDQNFGMLHVKGGEDNRRLVLETYGSDGEKLWDYSITEKELSNK